MAFLRKLGLILWKNWLFRKRHFIISAFDIGLPLLFTLLLVAMRRSSEGFDSTYVDKPTLYNKEEVYRLGYGSYVTIMYSPNTSHIANFMEVVKKTIEHNCLTNVSLLPVRDEEEMNKRSQLADLAHYSNLAGGIAFANEFAAGVKPLRKLYYRIRLRRFQWETTKLTHPFSDPGPQDYGNVYKFSDFLVYEHAIAMAFIELATGDANLQMTLYSQKFPWPPYQKDNRFSAVMEIIFPFLIILSYIFISPSLIKGIVLEKELGTKELTKLMGLPGWIQWLGWFISSFVVMAISALLIVALLCCPFGSSALLTYSRPELVLFVFLFYIASAIVFCFFISSLFSRPTLATAVGSLTWILTFIIPYYHFLHSYSRLALGEKMAIALLPNMAMAWALRLISSFESRTVGLQWEYLTQPAHKGENMHMLHVLLMFMLDILIYGLFTWYVDNVFPGKYGVGKPWYFLAIKSHWIKEKSDDLATPILSAHNTSTYFEKDPVGLPPVVIIKHLTKHYGIFKHSKPAVDDLSLNFYEGQITVLLGHNGAGKSTVMAMLSGLFSPTNGTAIINGYDITRQTAGARESLGLCPQENMLFDILTVKEHLVYFGKLKNLSDDELKREVDSLMMRLQLKEKSGTFAKDLSGGMKRKLSLGLALIGRNKVVMLDEPTSGLDPESRRAVWDLLQEYRPGRCIVLTTHFMEEADVLGDRIAIMARGKVQCCGTPYFLKKTFGTGYHMTISKTNDCDVDQLTSIIKRHLPDADFNTQVNNELSYILPAEKTRDFPDLFEELENNLTALGVNGFGISVTTMEEVFLKVGKLSETWKHDDLQSGDKPDGEKIVSLNTRGIQSEQNNTGRKLLTQQVYGLLLKRWHYSRRRWILVFAQVIMPVLMVVLLMYLSNESGKEVSAEVPLKMDILQYGKTIAVENHTQTVDGIALSKAYYGLFPHKGSVKTVGDIEQYLIEVGNKSYDMYREEHIVAAEFQSFQNGTSYITALYNGIYLHALPLAVNLIHNTILQRQTHSNDWNITVENAPLSLGSENIARHDVEMQHVRSVLMAVFIPIGLSFLSSSFVVFPIQERTSKSKHLQLMTGVGGTVFWRSAFLWDIMIYLASSSLMVGVFASMDQTKTFSGKEQAESESWLAGNKAELSRSIRAAAFYPRVMVGLTAAENVQSAYHDIGVVFSLLALYGWAAIPFSYLFSFFCKVPASGFSVLCVVNLISGMLLTLIIFFMTTRKSGDMAHTANILQYFFRLLPNYPITTAFVNMPLIATQNSLCEVLDANVLATQCKEVDIPAIIRQCCPDCVGTACLGRQSYFGWESPSIGQEAFMLGINGILYFLLLFFIEHGFMDKLWIFTRSVYLVASRALAGRRKHPVEDDISEKLSGMIDDDVALERNRVKQIFTTIAEPSDDALLVYDLTKKYSDLRAVDHLCFGVKHAECFGLLGINGAGKTTTFRMLTGDEVMTSGNAYLNGVSLKDNRRLFLKQIGYCPQFDALLDHLTGRETLFLFGRLRGIPEPEIRPAVSHFLYQFDLTQYADKITLSYSGGNKRKLSVAIAFLGNPSMVFLDEPTTGVDPVARRRLWENVLAAKSIGTSIILTSHSMEECEVLCNRLAIMVNGQFKCLGPIQHLKNKFGQGFTIIAKMSMHTGSILQTNTQQLLHQYMCTKFPGCVLKDIHQELLHYHIADRKTSWKYLFSTMEEAKLIFDLEDYSICQTTLEQVFLSFSRQQRMDIRKSDR